jgi:hypothetical protein
MDCKLVRQIIVRCFFKKKELNALSFKMNKLSLQAENQTYSFAMCALLSLYFKTIYFIEYYVFNV